MCFAILAFVLVGVCGFAVSVSAEEDCLRSGDGTCVEITREANSGGVGNPKYLLGDSISNSAMRLYDGSLVVAVARQVAEIVPDRFIRYEISLLRSTDHGLTWSEPEIQGKGSWYVDEIKAGGHYDTATDVPVYLGAYRGAGFLGFSVDQEPDSANKRTFLAITHSSTCRTNPQLTSDYEFNDPYGESTSDCDSDNIIGATIFFDFVVFDHDNESFIQVGETRSLTQMRSSVPNNPMNWGCPEKPCFAGLTGAYKPSISVSSLASGNQVGMWLSYYAYRGDICEVNSTYCEDQNGTASDGTARTELWARRFTIDLDDASLTSIQNDQIESSILHRTQAGDTDTCVVSSATSCLDERHAYYSTIRSTWGQAAGTDYPLLLYGYSRPNTTDTSAVNISRLRWAYWDGSTWQKQGYVQDVAGLWRSSQSSITEVLAAFDGSNGALSANNITVTPTLAAVASPQGNFYSPYTPVTGPAQHRVVHVATIANSTDAGGSQFSATPVYLRFYAPTAGNMNNPQGLILADQGNGDRVAQDAALAGNPDVRPNFYSGGLSIQSDSSDLFIATPGSPVPFTADTNKNTDIYFTRLSNFIEYGAGSNWAQDLSETWLDGDDGDTGFSSVPVWSQMTNANAFQSGGLEMANAAPHLFDYGVGFVEGERATSRSNLFLPMMAFVRGTYGAAEQCHNGTPCSVSFSGEQHTHGIRGWAWAEVVGWLSLSCENLNSCNKKSEPWSSKIGGTYYGVRAVAAPETPVQTLIGTAWSERVGYVSFSRADSVSDINPCGNPPGVVPGDPYYINPDHCARTRVAVVDSSDSVQISTNTFPAAPGYVVIDREVFRYTSTIPAGVDMILTNMERAGALANQVYHTVKQRHDAGTPIFYLGTQDPTSASTPGDVYTAINTFAPESFELTGWARALAWRDYQVSYCGTVGPGEPAPCDKEWGWIKLEGEWETIPRGTFAATSSCGTGDQVFLDSVDGYPVPSGGDEFIELRPMKIAASNNPRFFAYSGVDPANRRLTGVHDVLSSPNDPSPIDATPSCNNQDGNDVAWVTRLGASISSTSSSIPVESIAGLLPSGQVEILTDTDLNGVYDATPEIVEYTQINTSVSPPELRFADRGLEGTTALDYGNPTRTFVRPVQDTGSYNTFVIDLTDEAPEKTMLGFGWSAPTTDTITPDPFTSRYQNSLAGFGWINFQPNRLELIYPFLRTLFSDVYVGGNYSVIGPQATETNEYTSTYLLQGQGTVLPFLSGRTVNSRAYTECLNDPSISDPAVYCAPLAPVTQSPQIALNSGGLSFFGRLPTHDDLSTWVRDCRDKDGNLINGTGVCPDAEDQARHLPSNQSLPEGEAVSGVNRYGHHVILCRADPIISITDLRSNTIYSPNGWAGNPVECAWQNSIAWEGELGQDYDPSTDGTKVCVIQNNGAAVSDAPSITVGGETKLITIPGTNTCSGPGEVELTLDSALSGTVTAGSTVIGNDSTPFKKIRKSATGLPTVYTVPDDYGQQGPSGTVFFDQTPLQLNNGDTEYDWDVDGDGLLNDTIPGGTIEHGGVTFTYPGSIFFSDSHIRYCPTGLPGVPCRSEDDTTNALSDIRQLASLGWFVDGSVANLFGFGKFYPPEPRAYIAGSFLIYGEAEADRYCPDGVIGPCEQAFIARDSYGEFVSHYTLNYNNQLNVSGLVIARNFTLVGQYFVQGENEAIVEPAENFVYDGRVVANPPPGFEDVSSGLPTISQATP